MKSVYIREWGRLILGEETKQLDEERVDKLLLNPSSWKFLAEFASSNQKEHAYLKFINQTTLQVQNYVGVISTPDGTQIEILPKTSESELPDNQLPEIRRTLLKMLRSVDGVVPIETTDAMLNLEKMPLPEMLIQTFLNKLSSVVRKGIRKDYQRIEAEEKFLKGRLRVAQQLRQPAGKQHLFQIQYDVFSEDRAENRLIHSALVAISKWAKTSFNQKLARELRFAFDVVPESSNYKADFQQWRTSRDMIYYQPLLPWLRLILNQLSPFAVKDKHQGISFLFPMEMVFEKYVFKQLPETLKWPFKLEGQKSSKYLATQADKDVFNLRPDLAIYEGKECRAILDTKWKRINQNQTYANGDEDRKSGISQSDMYQLFAYGQKYLNGKGRMMLIYPKWGSDDFGFTSMLSPFQLDTDLYLDVVPYCLDTDQLCLNDKTLEDWTKSSKKL